MLVPTVTNELKLAELMPLKFNLLIFRRNLFLGRDFCLVGKEKNQQNGFKQFLMSQA